jgi:hypothetical protein
MLLTMPRANVIDVALHKLKCSSWEASSIVEAADVANHVATDVAALCADAPTCAAHK